jgi:hypothetical protein
MPIRCTRLPHGRVQNGTRPQYDMLEITFPARNPAISLYLPTSAGSWVALNLN